MKLLVLLLYLATASFFQGEGPISEEEKLYFKFIIHYDRNFISHQHYRERFNTFKSHVSSPLPKSAQDISNYADMEEQLYIRFTPDDLDWKKKGVVPGVMNQGQIGSSVVIAITEAVESAYAIKTGKMVSLNS